MTATILPMYTRLGSCEPRLCDAACCRFLTLEVNPIYRTDPDITAWVELHGIRLHEVDGRVVARIPLECSALMPNGQCFLYGKPERPELCEAFPMTPLALLGVEDVCTFAFTETDHGNGRGAEARGDG